MFLPYLLIITSHPTTPFVFSLIFTVLVLGFTSRDSPLRGLGLIPMLGCLQLALRIARTQPNFHQLYMNLLMGSTASMVSQYLDSVLLSRWTYEAQGPTSSLGGQINLRVSNVSFQRKTQSHVRDINHRLIFGWEEAFRARSASTPWQVKNTPRFFPDQLNMVPTKAQFLYWTARRCLASLLVVDIISFLGRDATLNSINFASSRIPYIRRLPDITAEEVVIRFISSFLNWAVTIFLLQALYDASAMIIIAVGLGRIERWPPLFNSWTECWSIRRFWGSFWHQGARQKFSAPANFLSFSILRLSKGTLLARYAVITLTFIVSGAIHQFGDVASGIPWHEAGAMNLFVMQAIGIIIEDTVQGLFRWVYTQERTSAKPTGWKRALGFVWLVVWLTWTTPSWVYPAAQRSTGEGILPFSLLRKLA